MDQHGNTQGFEFYFVVFFVQYYIIALYSTNKEVGNECAVMSCEPSLAEMTELYIMNRPYFLKHEF